MRPLARYFPALIPPLDSLPSLDSLPCLDSLPRFPACIPCQLIASQALYPTKHRDCCPPHPLQSVDSGKLPSSIVPCTKEQLEQQQQQQQLAQPTLSLVIVMELSDQGVSPPAHPCRVAMPRAFKIRLTMLETAPANHTALTCWLRSTCLSSMRIDFDLSWPSSPG